MAESTYVIGQEYCISDYPVELGILRDALTFTDVKNNILFNVEVRGSIHGRRILRDTTGNPIITLRKKMRTMHSRWQVFRGDSHDKKDLLFSTVKSSCFQIGRKLNVFLANNDKEEVSDFRLEGSFYSNSCAIYTGHEESKTILAQMTAKEGYETYSVTVNPNVDYAFIVALFVILDKVDHLKKEFVFEIVKETTNTVLGGVYTVISNL